ncbi:MAG TPA: cupin domain-containing protein [Chloroflexota bacterium]|nr:cupin domain-containing protein [Chloroflexota bacterium]
MIGERTVQANEIEQFHAELERDALEGLWRIQAQRRSPRSRVQPYVWRWETLHRHLLRAGDLLATLERGAERRVLVLANPGLTQFKAATHTIAANVQLIKPGEVAPAHRHTPTAIRFIIQGHGAYTTVEGEQIVMGEGDLILTPNWTWHDHGNETTRPVIWMDALDVPFVNALHASVHEPYPEERHPVLRTGDYSVRKYSAQLRPLGERGAPVFSPQRAYRWEATYATLTHLAAVGEASPYDDVAVEYVNPATGGHALPTLGCAIQLLRPGVRTRAHRHTSSAVYHVFRGRGYSVIDGQRFDWAQGDFFVLPPWAWHEHANTSPTEEAILFSVNDMPIFEAMALYREEPYPAHGGHQPQG